MIVFGIRLIFLFLSKFNLAVCSRLIVHNLAGTNIRDMHYREQMRLQFTHSFAVTFNRSRKKVAVNKTIIVNKVADMRVND